MELCECINEPLFRKEFINQEIDGLRDVISGNGSLLYHNEAKMSIMEEIKKKLPMSEIQKDVIGEHIEALRSIEQETITQNERLQIMIDVYETFQKSGNENKLKLA